MTAAVTGALRTELLRHGDVLTTSTSWSRSTCGRWTRRSRATSATLPAAVELLGRRAWWPTSRSAPHPPEKGAAATNGGGRFTPRREGVPTKV
jgi:hypothetical protein